MEVSGPEFLVDELLDLPTGDDMMMMEDAEAFLDSIHHDDDINNNNSSTTDNSSTNTPGLDTCNSSLSGAGAGYGGGGMARNCNAAETQLSGSELCVPCDDLAELEWLSNFVEESFSTEDLHKFQLVSDPNNGPAAQFQPDMTGSNPIFKSETIVPGKARSKLSRIAPSDWSTRLLMVSPASSSTDQPHIVAPKKPSKRREPVENPNGEVRRCLHCASEKTPQWRTGPMGPKTLCNACGVRYKSGRLVPEYRPAASPTFVSAKHSNSHRKVLELQRQKEMQLQHRHHHQHQYMSTQGGMFGISNGDDYLIRNHMGSDFRQMI
ncbi:GATA transcription factor 12-like protein [Drosera capensis]